jgi:hypothetical protein
MGIKKKVFNDGEIATKDEMQRLADNTAEADGAALDAMLAAIGTAHVGGGVPIKGLTPLVNEDQAFAASWETRKLVTVAALTTSACSVKPLLASCLEYASGSDYAARMQLSGRSVRPTDSPLFASNASGSSRTDLVYAVLQRSVSATGSRRVKAVDGSISTQTFDLETQPAVTFAIALGIAGVSPGVLPADSLTAFNFPLAYVVIPNGFVSGVTNVIATNITQAWSRVWVPPERLLTARPGSLHATAGGTLGKASTPLLDQGQRGSMSRWGAVQRVATVVKHAGASAVAIVIDDTIDWRNRVVRARILLGSNAGVTTYPPPEDATLVAGSVHSLESGPQYTGDGSGAFYFPTIAGNTPQFFAQFTTGKLVVIMNYATIGGVDNSWYMEFEASDQFKF